MGKQYVVWFGQPAAWHRQPENCNISFSTVNKIKPKIKSLSSKTVTIEFMTIESWLSSERGGEGTERQAGGCDILPK